MRKIMSAKFVTVIMIETEYYSYLIRDKQHFSFVLKDDSIVSGEVLAMDYVSNKIYIETNRYEIKQISLDEIVYLN